MQTKSGNDNDTKTLQVEGNKKEGNNGKFNNCCEILGVKVVLHYLVIS